MNNTELELAPDYESPPSSPSNESEEIYENQYEEYIENINTIEKQRIDEIITYSDNMMFTNFLDFVTYIFYFDSEQLYMNAGLITIIIY